MLVTPRRSAVALALASLLACGEAPRPADPALAAVPATPASFDVEVGTGQSDFEPLADGADVVLVHGAQGGWHVWTAFRVRGAALRDVRVNLFARFDDGSAAGAASAIALTLGERPMGEQIYAGLRDLVFDGDQARGRRLVLRVEVIASDGRHGAGERTVIAR